jgi:hypothetical protein
VIVSTYCNRLNPVLYSNVYGVDDLASASVEDVDAAVITSSDNGAVSIVKSDIANPSCSEWNVEGLDPVSRRQFVHCHPLRDVVDDQCIFLDVDGSVSTGSAHQGAVYPRCRSYSHHGPGHSGL